MLSSPACQHNYYNNFRNRCKACCRPLPKIISLLQAIGKCRRLSAKFYRLHSSPRCPCAIEQGKAIFPYSPRGVRTAKLPISLRTHVHKNQKSPITFYLLSGLAFYSLCSFKRHIRHADLHTHLTAVSMTLTVSAISASLPLTGRALHHSAHSASCRHCRCIFLNICHNGFRRQQSGSHTRGILQCAPCNLCRVKDSFRYHIHILLT